MTESILAAGLLLGQVQGAAEPPLAHTRAECTFELEGSFEAVMPLFGAEGERAWAGPEWDPRFLHPVPPRDEPGMVFTTEHGGHHATWVNTALDLQGGHVQYVALVDGALATTVDVVVTRRPHSGVRVRIVYERTALRKDLNDHVRSLGARDAQDLPEWRAALQAVLPKGR